MTTISPSLPSLSSFSPATGTMTATVLMGGDALMNVPLNSVIEATALSNTLRGVVELQTIFGDLQVRLPISLSNGAQVLLQVIRQGNSPQVRLLSVNGQQPSENGEAVAKNTLNVAENSDISAQQLTIQQTEISKNAASQQNSILGVLLRSMMTAGSPPSGTKFSVRLQSFLTPGPVSGDEEDAETPTVSLSDTPDSSTAIRLATRAYTPAVTPQPPILPGDILDLTPDSTDDLLLEDNPATEETVEQDDLLPGETRLSGTVTVNSAAGRMLLQTQWGLLSLDTPLRLPAGSQVELSAVELPMSPAHENDTTQQTGWTAIDQIVQILTATNSNILPILLQRLPALGPIFGSMLFLLSCAARSGNPSDWLGERSFRMIAGVLIEDQHHSLVEQLQQDIANMCTPVRLPGSSDEWQMLLLPFWVGPHMEHVKMVLPRRSKASHGVTAENGVRFLVDVSMSRLGALQLDGFIRHKSKRFDLIIRTHQGLSSEARTDITHLFNGALSQLGFSGDALFQQSQVFVEVIRPDDGNTSKLII